MFMALSKVSEDRIRKITQLYYSKPEVLQAMYDFCKKREISPRYFEGFGKRPDSFQYKNDIFELVKRGATSFHCSEEIWTDPLEISTDMNSAEYDKIRTGWDLLIDIDCKWFDYSKLAAKSIILVLKEQGVSGVGLKFSGSKGFHILVPWKAFPKEIAGKPTKNLFPDLPRDLVAYIRFAAEKKMRELLPSDFYSQFKNLNMKEGKQCNNCGEIAGEIDFVTFYCPKCEREEQKRLKKEDKRNFSCPECRVPFEILELKSRKIYICQNCNIDSERESSNFSASRNQIDLFELMGLDLVLVSPRHLFRAPYSLHEKTSLSSIVIDFEELDSFEMKNADPMSVKIKNFMPDSVEGEAKELLIRALDWIKENKIQRGEDEEKISGKYANFKPVELKNVEESQFPPCIKKLLEGIVDGKKRGLFALLHLFRSIGMDQEKMEKKIFEWNEKNKPPLKKGYVVSQLAWAYKRKPLMPPNCKEFYQGMGVCSPDNSCSSIKNPLNYVVRKNFIQNNSKKKFKSPDSVK